MVSEETQIIIPSMMGVTVLSFFMGELENAYRVSLGYICVHDKYDDMIANHAPKEQVMKCSL